MVRCFVLRLGNTLPEKRKSYESKKRITDYHRKVASCFWITKLKMNFLKRLKYN